MHLAPKRDLKRRCLWRRFWSAFCSDFGPLGAPSGAQNRTQNRARAGPGLPGPHLGVALASSERHLSLTKALVVALGPFLAPILAHWASFWTLRAPFWTLRDSILDPPGLCWGPSRAPFWIFLGHVWSLLAPDLLQYKKPKLENLRAETLSLNPESQHATFHFA